MGDFKPGLKYVPGIHKKKPRWCIRLDNPAIH